ncbi:unnamed protein product [Alternaria alternata]
MPQVRFSDSQAVFCEQESSEESAINLGHTNARSNATGLENVKTPALKHVAKTLSVCGHPCLAPCHFPQPCREEKPCPHKIFVTCECQRIKQEAKCNAWRNGDGNLKKVLKCDKECARLERNRVLALALNVDPEHQNDHIPYSDATLNMYQQNATWAVTQEKQLQTVCCRPGSEASSLQTRCPVNLRKFIHYLAEDFGMDSESINAEPHRHVAIFRDSKKSSNPTASCPYASASNDFGRSLRPNQDNTNGDPYNAFIILNPRFALTIEELNPIIKSVLAQHPSDANYGYFLPSEAVALKPPLAARLSVSGKNVQPLRPRIFDSSLNILRKESDVGPGSGWSQVAASKGVPLRQIQKTTGFGNKGGFAKKKKQKEPVEEVAENWEEAEEEEEQKEKVSGANSAAMSEDEGISKNTGEASDSKAASGEDEGAPNGVSEASVSMPASDENSVAPKDDVALSTKPLGRWRRAG